jgi:hypothetical protein
VIALEMLEDIERDDSGGSARGTTLSLVTYARCRPPLAAQPTYFWEANFLTVSCAAPPH